MTYLQFFSEIFLIYVLSFALMHSLGRTTRSYTALRLFLLPGVMIHELSHALACLVTMTPIEQISFWTETGGKVVHHKPKLHLVTQPIISIAPFIVGIFLLFEMSQFLTHQAWYWVIVLALLMTSIAATLAPSQVDLLHALEGSVVLLVIVGGLAYYFPHSLNGLTPLVAAANAHLLLVLLLLIGLWIISWLIRFGLSKII